MEEGTVKIWKATYGFIRHSKTGREYFVHFKNLVMEGFKKLECGQKVTFSIGKSEGSDKEQAINVIPLVSLNETFVSQGDGLRGDDE